MNKGLRCLLGFHKYKEIAYKDKVGTIDECQICGHQRVWAYLFSGAEAVRKELGVKKKGNSI